MSSSSQHKQHHLHRTSQTNRSKSSREIPLNGRSNSTQQLHARSRAQVNYSRSKSAKPLQPRSDSTTRLQHAPPKKRQSSRRMTSGTIPGPGKVLLPCGHVGLWFEGSPAILTDVSEGSPVGNQARGKVGLAVSAMVIPGEIEVYGPISTDELVELLNDFSDVERRVLMFDQVETATKTLEVVSKIHLPTHDASVRFSGRHPNIKVSNVVGDSRTVKKVKIGQVVHRLEFRGEAPYFASVGANTLNVLLAHHEKTQGNILVVGYPFTPNGDDVAVEETRKSSLKAKDIRKSFHEWKRQTARR